MQQKRERRVCRQRGPDDDIPDSEKDTIPDSEDNCPFRANADQFDTDKDGVGDECPSDRRKTLAGTCGCGKSEANTDRGGVPDCADECPRDPEKIAAGVCGCGRLDADSDTDGVPDCVDACADTEPGSLVDNDGCSVDVMPGQPVPADSDGDGVSDNVDLCSITPDGEMVDEHGCPTNSAFEQLAPDGCGAGNAPCGAMGMISLWITVLGLGRMRVRSRCK